MFLSEKEREETIWACRFCPMCQVADRVGSIVRRESYTPRGRGAILFALDRGLLEWDDTVADIMYTTLNDGLIQAWCVGRYDHEELILDARARLFERGLAPEGVAFFLNNLRSARGAGKEPTRILREADVKIHPGAEVLLFGGCAVRESQTALVAAGMLFNMASLPFQVIPRGALLRMALLPAGGPGGGTDVLSPDCASNSRFWGKDRGRSRWRLLPDAAHPKRAFRRRLGGAFMSGTSRASWIIGLPLVMSGLPVHSPRRLPTTIHVPWPGIARS